MLLFFCCFIILIALLIYILKNLTIQIKLENYEKRNMEDVKDKSNIKINILIGDRIKILQIKIKEKGKLINRKMFLKAKKIFRKKDLLNKIEDDIKEIPKDEINKYIKEFFIENKIEFRIYKVRLRTKIGIGDVILTSYLIAILSSVMAVVLSEFGKERYSNKYRYTFYPEYKEGVNYELSVTGTIGFSLWNIFIAIIKLYYLIKLKDKNNIGKDNENVGCME